jgi:hypothetical protein
MSDTSPEVKYMKDGRIKIPTPPPSFTNDKIDGYHTRPSLHKASGRTKYYYYRKPISKVRKTTLTILMKKLRDIDASRYVEAMTFLDTLA